MVVSSNKSAYKDFVVLQSIRLLEQAEWLSPPLSSPNKKTSDSVFPNKNYLFPTITPSQIRLWMASVKSQEHALTQMHQNSSTPQLLFKDTVHETEHCNSDNFYSLPSIVPFYTCPSTLQPYTQPQPEKLSSAEMVALSQSQRLESIYASSKGTQTHTHTQSKINKVLSFIAR